MNYIYRSQFPNLSPCHAYIALYHCLTAALCFMVRRQNPVFDSPIFLMKDIILFLIVCYLHLYTCGHIILFLCYRAPGPKLLGQKAYVLLNFKIIAKRCSSNIPSQMCLFDYTHNLYNIINIMIPQTLFL